LQKWDKRWFVLQGGSTTLNYYKSERDADNGKPPSGGVSCASAHIERASVTANSGWGSSGFEIEFVLHTAERMLGLRTNSEDTFRLWVGALVAAGARAPLQKDALCAHSHRPPSPGHSSRRPAMHTRAPSCAPPPSARVRARCRRACARTLAPTPAQPARATWH
jgi:hypothetical protein